MGLSTRDLGSASDADRESGFKDHFAPTRPRSGSEQRVLCCVTKEINRFLSHKIFTWYLGTQYLYALKFLSHGAAKNTLNVRNLQR